MEFGFQVPCAHIAPEHAHYRPPHWPPPRDWVVSLDAKGNALSLWGSDEWNFSLWAGRNFKLDFIGGKHSRSAQRLGFENQESLRLLSTLLVWGARGAGSWNTLKKNFQFIRRIVSLCEKENISIKDLERFPRVIDKIPTLFSDGKSRDQALLLLDRLRRGKEAIGFTVLGEHGLARLAQAYLEYPLGAGQQIEQTAYIPPRIWNYQIRRLRECLDDFLQHANEIEACYHYCVDAYVFNFGSLEKAVAPENTGKGYVPFTKERKKPSKLSSGRYFGPFIEVARRFGIAELLARWVNPPEGQELGMRQFGGYLTLIQLVAPTYIMNFTLQRKEEAAELRADCLIWEADPRVGKVAIIRGETTKTDPDDDARWPTSPHVEIAINAASKVAKMRMRCIAALPATHCSDYDVENPLLYQYSVDPWAPASRGIKPYSTRPLLPSYQAILARFPLLMDESVLRISEEELIKARMFTPNLDKNGQFAVGNTWPLAFHQLRRTSCINMFASGLLSDSSIQVIMKHLALLQTAYYGANYSRVRFNEDIEGQTNSARYEVMAKQIETLVSERYVSPLGNERKTEIVVNLLDSKDYKALIKAGKKGEVSFRETRLGGCTKRGHCDYGGIESIARCAGGDGDKACRDAIFDKNKRASAQRSLENVEARLQLSQGESPRAKALYMEAQGLRNFLNVTRD